MTGPRGGLAPVALDYRVRHEPEQRPLNPWVIRLVTAATGVYIAVGLGLLLYFQLS